jgi:hypothetical protein
MKLDEQRRNSDWLVTVLNDLATMVTVLNEFHGDGTDDDRDLERTQWRFYLESMISCKCKIRLLR